LKPLRTETGIFTMTARILTATALTLGLALPAQADPTLGLGLSFSFGGGSVETGVGVRLFSDDQRDSAVATVGVDYMFQSKRIRPTVGAAYLGDNRYIGLDMGFDLNGGGVDFGVGVGGVNTQDKPTGDASEEQTPQQECENIGGFWTGNSCV
jgi:hypothetical protein